MGIRTVTDAPEVTPEDAFKRINTQALLTRDFLITKKATMQSAAFSAYEVISLLDHISSVLPRLTAASQVPGVVAFARDYFNDQTFDPAADFQGFRGALVALRDQTIASFPKDGNGVALYETFLASGRRQAVNFAAAQWASTIPFIDAVVNSINLPA